MMAMMKADHDGVGDYAPRGATLLSPNIRPVGISH